MTVHTEIKTQDCEYTVKFIIKNKPQVTLNFSDVLAANVAFLELTFALCKMAVENVREMSTICPGYEHDDEENK